MRLFIAYILIFAGLFSKAQTYPNYNISLLANISPETVNNWYALNTKYAGCFGWHNPVDNKEYAILGSTTGNHFIEVTNPIAPVVRDFVPAATQNNLWREIQTYQNYAYLVSDDNGSSLQIVDMSYLPDSVHVVYDSNALFTRSHTIFISGNKLYCGSAVLVGGGFYPMAVYDISNPVSPVFLRGLNEDFPSAGYVHDMFVKNDTIFASHGNAGLFIYKFNANNTFSLLADYTNYLLGGYNHSSSLTPDSKTLIFTDEVPTGLPVKVLDVSDLGNLTLTDTIVSHPGATPHNIYVMNDYHVAISYYQDGVYLYDISNPNKAILKGFFDTDPAHGDNDNYTTTYAYQGCWGAYPYLPSGILLASDMQNGLFVLDMDDARKKSTVSLENYIKLYPNPSNGNLNLVVSAEEKGDLNVVIYDVTGKKIVNRLISKTENVMSGSIDISHLSKGPYIVKLIGTKVLATSKLIIAD
ncbi:MAG: choice-of-anchor B family protein [Bacteroidota bacterium]|nr:choice-of-anchor B family protein [Bacteroidota bacterium]